MSRDRGAVTPIYQEELEQRLKAVVRCDAEESKIREFKALADKHASLVQEATLLVWGSRQPTAPPIADSNLVADIDEIKMTRERIQHNLATAFEVEQIPSISDTIENQFNLGIPVIPDEHVLAQLQQHFANYSRALRTSRKQHLLLFMRAGGIGVHDARALRQLKLLDGMLSDCSDRLARLGAPHPAMPGQAHAQPADKKDIWQVQESDVRHLVRHKVFQQSCQGSVRQFYYRVMWLPHSHRTFLLEKALEAMVAIGNVQQVYTGMRLQDREEAHQRKMKNSSKSRPPMLARLREALEAELSELKAFFDVEEGVKNNRLGVRASAILSQRFPHQSYLRQPFPPPQLPDPSPSAGPPKEGQDEASGLVPPEEKIFFEMEELDERDSARFADLWLESLLGSNGLPVKRLDYALSAENGFLDVDDLEVVRSRVADLASTHYARAQARASQAEKETFLSVVTGAGDPIRPVRASVKDKSKGSRSSSPTASAKHRASPGHAEPKTEAEGAHNLDSDSDDEEDGGGSSRKGMPPLPHKAMEAMYSLRLVRTRCYKLRLLYTLNSMEAMRRRLIREAANESAGTRDADSAGLSEEDMKHMAVEQVAADSEVGERLHYPRRPGEPVQYFVFHSCMQQFKSMQEHLLGVGSHYIEVLRRECEDEEQAISAINRPRMLEQLYEMEAEFAATKLDLMKTYLGVYDEATDPDARNRLRTTILRVAVRRPELHPDDSYFAAAYSSATLSLKLEIQTLQEIVANQRGVEAKKRLQMFGRLSRPLSSASPEGLVPLSPISPEDAVHMGLPLPLVDFDTHALHISRHDSPSSGPNSSYSMPHGSSQGGEKGGAADLFPTTSVLSFFHSALNDALAALCEVHHLTSPREIAAMRQVVMEQVLVEWRLTLQEEKLYAGMEPSQLERACRIKKPLEHSHLGLQFVDNPLGWDLLFDEAQKEHKMNDLVVEISNEQRRQTRAAGAVWQLLRTHTSLVEALRETRVLAAAHTSVAMELGVNIVNQTELDPIDFSGLAGKPTRLEDVERRMLPRVQVPTVSANRISFAAAQFDASFAHVNLSTIKGIEETVCVAGMERLQRMLRMQWAEANLLSTAVRHNCVLLDSVNRVALRRRASMGLKVKQELQARWAAEAKAMAVKSELGDNSSNFFLTAVRHSVTYTSEPNPYMDPPQLPLTSALIQVDLNNQQREEVREETKEMLALVYDKAMSPTAIKLQLRARYLQEYTTRNMQNVKQRRAGGAAAVDASSRDLEGMSQVLKGTLADEYVDEIVAIILPWAQRTQVALASYVLRRLVAGAHGPPQSAVGEVRAGPFDAGTLELAHVECLHDVRVEEDARRAMGVRGDWWQTEVPATQLKRLIFEACMLEEDGYVNSVFVLSSPLETMSLPLENNFLRQLWTITQTLVDIVQLRMAVLSMQVPVDEIQGHIAPGQPALMTELSVLQSEISFLNDQREIIHVMKHLKMKRELTLLRYQLALQHTSDALADKGRPFSYALVRRLMHTLQQNTMAESLERDTRTANAGLPLPHPTTNTFLSSVALTQPLDTWFAMQGMLPPTHQLRLYALQPSDRLLVHNCDSRIGLLLEGKLKDDHLYNMMQPQRAMKQQLYVCHVHLTRSLIRAHMGEQLVPGLERTGHPHAPCPTRNQLEALEGVMTAVYAKVDDDMKSALSVTSAEEADPGLLRRRQLLLSNVGCTSDTAQDLQRAETCVYRGKKKMDELVLTKSMEQLEAECQVIMRDVAVLYPTVYKATAQEDIVSAFVSKLHQLGFGHITPKTNDIPGLTSSEDTTYMVKESDLKLWCSHFTSRVFLLLEQQSRSRDESTQQVVESMQLEMRMQRAAFEQFKAETLLERQAMTFRLKIDLCDLGLALFHEIDSLKRTVEFKDYMLGQQEAKLRIKLREEFEANLKELEYKVDVAQTKEQRHIMETKEKLLTEMATLRKETMLKFQLHSWVVEATDDKTRADMMEVELSFAKAREMELERTILVMNTLSRLRGRITEASLDRRMKAYMEEREKSDALEWGQIQQADAKAIYLEEKLHAANLALRHAHASLKRTTSEVNNQKRQKGKLMQWKVQAGRKMSDLEEKVGQLERRKPQIGAPRGPTAMAPGKQNSVSVRAVDNEESLPKEEDGVSSKTSAAGTGASAAKEVAPHRDRDRERRARLGLDTTTRSKEHALQMEIAHLKKKLAVEQHQKQEVETKLEKLQQERRTGNMFADIPESRELRRRLDASDGGGSDRSRVAKHGEPAGALGHLIPFTIQEQDVPLMDTLQAEIWQKRYHEETERIQQLELENEAMREALIKIEGLVPGVTQDLVPENLSRPSSGVSSRHSRPWSSTTYKSSASRPQSAVPSSRPPSATNFMSAMHSMTNGPRAARPPSAPAHKQRPMSGVPTSRMTPNASGQAAMIPVPKTTHDEGALSSSSRVTSSSHQTQPVVRFRPTSAPIAGLKPSRLGNGSDNK